MPQLLIAAVVGIAAYAGYRWFDRQLTGRQATAANRVAEQQRRREAGADEAGGGGMPKDLGALDWDETAKAYRPRPRG